MGYWETLLGTTLGENDHKLMMDKHMDKWLVV
jgi:hypothetical protein